MTAYNLDCPPFDACGPCGTLPSGFVRLRYFFGKRMGVADFVDEQRYHAGKLRFHNQHMHGAGLLCGLGVTRQSPTDVILRVGKGAAIDDCGREIVVGYDQCIDLDAWYQRAVADQRATTPTWPTPALDANGNLPLVVAIRYRECAASPEPAPRDTCSCDATGCDNGRVREEFELALFAPDAHEVTGTAPITPAEPALDRALNGALGEATLARALADAASTPPVDPDAERWLVLAQLALVLAPAPTAADPGHVVDVTGLAGAATLLAETALLQELLLRDVGAHLQAGALAAGPEITKLDVVKDGATTGYFLTLALSNGVIKETIPATAFTVTSLATTGTPGWSSAAGTTDYVPPTPTTPALIRVRIDNAGGFLAKGKLYRLAIDPTKVTSAQPIVDDQMRPLLPLRPALQFSLDEPTTGAFQIAPAPYAR
jgi:hypothetical protein